MKRIIAIILVSCMACLALASCVQTPSTTPSGTAPSTSTAAPSTTAPKTPEKFSLSKSSAFIFEKESLSITANGEGNDNVKWTSSDPAVAEVKADGTVKGVKSGSATITAESSKGEKLTCTVNVIKVSDYFTLADHTKVQIKQSEINQEIEKDLQSMAEYFATKKAVAREIKEGDVATIYFVGTLEGETEPFEGGTGSNDLEIGSNSFIDGFEDGLIGYKKGDTVTLNLTFPDNYGAEGSEQAKFNGKGVTFVVTINEVSEYVPAEITDDLVKKATNSEYSTLSEYKAYLNDAVYEYLVIEKVIAASEIKDYQKDMLLSYKLIYLQNTYGRYATIYGVTVAEYLKMIGISEEDANKEAEENAKPYIEQLYLCYGFYSDETVTIPDEKRTALVKEYASMNGLDKPEDLLLYITQADIDNYVMIEYAIDCMVEGVEYVNDTENAG